MTTEVSERPSSDELIAELKEKLSKEREKAKAAAVLVKEKDAEIRALKPTMDVTSFLFETVDDVRAFFGDEQLIVKVKERVAAQNRILMRQGFDRLPTDDESIARMVEELLVELVDDRNQPSVVPPSEGWLDRTIKMLKPPDYKTLVQIPYEGQINNVAGSLADGLVRYERKGYKRTEPMLCPSKDCYNPSATHPSGAQKGKWSFDSYCSEDHRYRTERGGATAKVPGLT